jgi:hypothetical protein
MRHERLVRVIALDLHPRRFGYVVLERPDRLLDWGVCTDRRKRHSGDALIQKRLKRVLALWSPSVILLRDRGGVRRSICSPNRLLKRIVAEAKDLRIPVCSLEATNSRPHGKSLTHHENARRVAERFPSLEWEVPPKRRAWESEHYRTSIFTAASLAMSHIQLLG